MNKITVNSNNATGFQALFHTTTGVWNNAFGYQALFFNTMAVANTGYGYQALFDNVTGNSNTGIGDGAGASITGSGNICIGASVFGLASDNNTARIGVQTGTAGATYIAGIYRVAEPGTVFARSL